MTDAFDGASEAGQEPAAPRRCPGTTASGAPCAVPSALLLPSGWCWSHDPSVEPERKLARTTGGLTATRRRGQVDPALEARLRALSDEELMRELERELSGEAQREREREAAQADPVFGHLAHLSDDELLAAYHAATAEAQAAEAERRQREPEPPAPEPIVAVEPPEEIHAVAVPEPKAATPPEPELTPEEEHQRRRREWEREQHQRISAAIAEATQDGERQARQAHEMGKRAPSETMGAGEFVDQLLRERGK